MMDRGDQQAILKYICLHIFIMLWDVSFYNYKKFLCHKIQEAYHNYITLCQLTFLGLLIISGFASHQ